MLKHEYLNLNMGLVKENFGIIKRKDIKLWKSRGFKVIRKYPIFHYKPNFSEVIMLGKPLDIEQFGTEKLINSNILDVCTFCGTYGMGGPGFFGLKLQGDYGIRWLTYCIWAAGEHILLNNKILECHPKFEQQYNPWIDSDDYANHLEKLKRFLYDMKIVKIILSKDTFIIHLIDSNGISHSIETYQFSNHFPEQGGTEKKRNSFENGCMKDYWLITYDDSHLVV